MASEIFKQTTKKNNDDKEILLTLTRSEAIEIAHYILYKMNKEDGLPFEIRDKIYRQIMKQIKQ